MKPQIYMDGEHEMIMVPLLMQKRNFDAMVAAEENDTHIPVKGMSFRYDKDAVDPVVRLMSTSDEEMKEIQREMGFHGLPASEVIS